MPSQSEIIRDGIIMHPYINIAKEINVEPIYKCDDDFYQRTDQLAYEPIENARYSAIAYGMYEQRIWGTLTTQNSRVYISLQITHSDPNTQSESGYTLFSIVDNAIKPKFSGTSPNIPLNAVMFAYKGQGYPILWNGAIPIDCFINPNGNVIINTMCQPSLTDDFCVQVCDSYAIYNQSAS
ncbi:MAG: hypothetical protein EZS28_025945 [Streblomastix strix]|uniref:Uncharacterized protein n=1 Tax=Streblomastix strix TaxID=222440 RepID=A0A5J4V788_9EUKA|nr:MAG: hypothetical protein EZS28_025945 [Streblomastix strix]